MQRRREAVGSSGLLALERRVSNVGRAVQGRRHVLEQRCQGRGTRGWLKAPVSLYSASCSASREGALHFSLPLALCSAHKAWPQHP